MTTAIERQLQEAQDAIDLDNHVRRLELEIKTIDSFIEMKAEGLGVEYDLKATSRHRILRSLDQFELRLRSGTHPHADLARWAKALCLNYR
tara:strand:+ start:588 stop:860 length:273 start_codon:yes stop_codon:yes gene_type:complete